MFAVPNRNLLVGMSGFFAGMASTAFNNWSALPKAAMVMGVCVVVSLVVAALTREKSPGPS